MSRAASLDGLVRACCVALVRIDLKVLKRILEMLAADHKAGAIEVLKVESFLFPQVILIVNYCA